MNNVEVERLNAFAMQLRRDVVNSVYHAKDGHPGPCMSIADILAVLYGRFLKIDPANPQQEDRDRFILSKGHACPVLYAALARKGYFAPSELKRLRTLDSMLQGHPDMRKTPGIEATSGSLGHGLPQGLGMALAARIRGIRNQVVVVTGDGELEEGIVWEAAMAAAKYRLSNLIAIVDNNHMQSGGTVEDVGGLYPLKEKWLAFGWNVLEIDGHDVAQIAAALDAAAVHRDFGERIEEDSAAYLSAMASMNGLEGIASFRPGFPVCIIAHTTKGKGVPYMEGDNSWHKRVPTDAEYALAMQLLEGKDLDEA